MEKNKKIKILFTEPVSDMGGVSYFILKIIEFLPREFYEIHFAASGNGEIFNNLEEFGVILHKLPINYNSLISIFKAIFVLRRLLKEEKFDIVHAHTAKSGFVFSLLIKRYRYSLVYTGHGWRHLQKKNFLATKLMYFFENFIAIRADYLTFLSNKEMKYGAGIFNFIEQKSSVIPISINVDNVIKNKDELMRLRHNYNLPLNSFIIVMVGRITKQKDPDTFLNVILEFYKKDIKNIHFVWVGDGELRNYVEYKAKELGINNLFHVTGFVDKMDVKNILSTCDLMLFTSLFEGLPISIIEAMSIGLPVVSADVGSISDIILDKKSGRLFRRGDFSEAFNIIYELIENQDKLHEYSINAFKIVKKNFSPKEKISEKFNLLYKDILKI